jgi:single-strand DNA-binding protein
MSNSVNKVILVGHLCAKPELKRLPSGQAVCEMRLATNETFTDREDRRQERPEFHRVVAWERTAETCARHLDKGRLVYVEGRLQTRSWDAPKSGEKRYITEIVASKVTFLSGGSSNGDSAREGSGPGSDRRQPEPKDRRPAGELNDDDAAAY